MRTTTPGRRPAPSRRTAVPARTRRHVTNARPRIAAAPAPPARTMTLTTRAAVLGLTLCAVLLMLAYPTKEYLGQRSQIAAAEASQQQLRQQLTTLGQEHARNLTPAEIEAQARARLHLVTPGTRNYIQLAPTKAAAPTTRRAGNATVPLTGDGSWFGTLWGSDTSAGS